jgi:DNA primase
MTSPVTTIKERLKIEDVVSSYIKLERTGANYKARCPFHNEKTASFFISPDRGSFYCFGCGVKGDIFTFVEGFEGLDFKGALKLLADRAGVTLGEWKKEDQEKEGDKDRLYKAMEESAKFYSDNLLEHKEVKEYLLTRGLTEKTIQEFRIGFAKDDWRTLYFYLSQKGFTDTELEKAGLAKKTDKGMYDRFRNRVMFPISDSSGRVIAFSGRIFTDDGKSAKYLNSPDTPIFNKSVVLFGLDKAKESIRKNNFSILVEGQMDLVLSHQAGFKNTVATSGTALSDSNISREYAIMNIGVVRRLSSNLVLAFDADKAGFKAAERAGSIALSLGMDVKVADLPLGVDPADLISKEGSEAWKEAIRKSKHLIEFLLSRIMRENNDPRKAGRIVKETVLPFVNDLESSIEKAHFLNKISGALGVPEEALIEDLKKIEEQKKRGVGVENIEGKTKEEKADRKDYILRRLLGIIFLQNGKEKREVDTESILKELSLMLALPEAEILAKFEIEKEDLIFEAEVFYGDNGNLKKDADELLSNLKKEHLEESRARKITEMHTADEKRQREILQEINDINNKIEKIKNIN